MLKKVSDQKSAAASKKVSSWKKAAIAAALAVILTVIAVPAPEMSSQDARNEAAQLLLLQIASVEVLMQTKCMLPPSVDAFTDGIDETAETAVERMAKLGFRPDPSVAFHIMRPPAVDGRPQQGFIAFAAHNSPGSTVYVCDYYLDTHGDILIIETHEKSVHGDVPLAEAPFDLYCYKYNSSRKTNPVKKSSTPIQFAPEPGAEAPARMIVAVPAKF